MSVGNAFRIPNYLEARTKDELVRAMLLNNIKHGIEFKYFDIQKDGSKWVCWFNMPVDEKAFVIEQVKGAASGNT